MKNFGTSSMIHMNVIGSSRRAREREFIFLLIHDHRRKSKFTTWNHDRDWLMIIREPLIHFFISFCFFLLKRKRKTAVLWDIHNYEYLNPIFFFRLIFLFVFNRRHQIICFVLSLLSSVNFFKTALSWEKIWLLNVLLICLYNVVCLHSVRDIVYFVFYFISFLCKLLSQHEHFH